MAMSKEEYQQWKHHPLTQSFHQYLKDYRKAVMESWAQGRLSQQGQIAAQVRCEMADEISTLDDDSIANFYAANKGEVHVSAD